MGGAPNDLATLTRKVKAGVAKHRYELFLCGLLLCKLLLYFKERKPLPILPEPEPERQEIQTHKHSRYTQWHIQVIFVEGLHREEHLASRNKNRCKDGVWYVKTHKRKVHPPHDGKHCQGPLPGN
jgi:hypothetical protein